MSLNKTLSSSGVSREGWAGISFQLRVSKGLAVCHKWYENFIYNVTFNVSEIKMYFYLEMEGILKMKETGLNFQTRGHMKTSAHSTVFYTESYLNTYVL